MKLLKSQKDIIKIFGLILLICTIILLAVYLASSFLVKESYITNTATMINTLNNNKISDIVEDVKDMSKLSKSERCKILASIGRCKNRAIRKHECPKECKLQSSNVKNNNNVMNCSKLLANQSKQFSNQINDILKENKYILDENNKHCDIKEEELTTNFTNIINEKKNEITNLTSEISNLENSLIDEKIVTNNLQKELQEKNAEINDLKYQLISNRNSNFQNI